MVFDDTKANSKSQKICSLCSFSRENNAYCKKIAQEICRFNTAHRFT